jgi:putative sigma-54 modulation protein
MDSSLIRRCLDIRAGIGEREIEPVQIKISARHGHLAEPTQQFIREKAEKLLHFFERLTSIEVTVDLNDVKTVEILVSAEHKHDFVARESHADVLAAVELVVAKLERQINRYKEKIQDHRRRPSLGAASGTPATE